MKRRTSVVEIVAAAILALAVLSVSGCDEGETDKAGGSGPPVTLRIGTDDAPHRPASDAIEYFAEQVGELSDETIRIVPEFRAAGENIRAWDQQVARMVISGELDMGMIPARAWDTEGVTSLRALQAPFLVTDDELLDRVVDEEDIADQMLDGLEDAGVVGLALMPEGLRHPVGFGRPLLSAADYEGATIRAPLSDTTYDLLRALGARPVDLASDEFEQAAGAGELHGVESSYQFAADLPRQPEITGNVVLFAKVNAVVINSKTWSELTDEQRATLEEAADLTRQHAIETRVEDADAAAEACETGTSVVAASQADIDGLVAAAQEVYDELEQDPQTKELIEQIQVLKGEASAPPGAPSCERPETNQGAEPSTDASVLNGTYRYEVSEEYLIDAGVRPAQAREESGVHTVTVDDGTFTDAWRNEYTSNASSGVYSIAGKRVTFEFTVGEAHWSATYEDTGAEIRWSRIKSLPPYNSDYDDVLNRAFNTVWVRID